MSFNDHCFLVVTELTLYIGGYLFIWYSVILNIIILQYFWHTTLRLQTDVLFWVRHFFYEFVSMHHITWQDLLLLHVLFDDMCCVIMCSQWKNYYNTSTNTVTAHIVHRQKDTFRTCCWGDWASTCLNNNSWISLETQSRWRSVTCLPSSGLGKNEYIERPNWTLACIYKYSTYMDSMNPAASHSLILVLMLPLSYFLFMGKGEWDFLKALSVHFILSFPLISCGNIKIFIAYLVLLQKRKIEDVFIHRGQVVIQTLLCFVVMIKQTFRFKYPVSEVWFIQGFLILHHLHHHHLYWLSLWLSSLRSIVTAGLDNVSSSLICTSKL